MQVLNLSLDPQLLAPQSVAATRARAYGARLTHYTILLPLPAAQDVALSETVTVVSTGGRFKLQRLWRLYQLARRELADQQYDVITSQDTYFLGALAVVLARRFQTGLEVQVHGFEKWSPLRRWLSRMVLRRAAVVRVVSERLKRRVVEEFAVPVERVVVIPVYVDTSSLALGGEQPEAVATQQAQYKTQHALQFANRFNLLTVGRLVPEKNIEMQLEAVAALVPQHPTLHLHIVGDGPLRPALEAAAAMLGIAKHVTFYGRKEGVELGVLYTLADCFLLTSHSEGWGMVIFEAATAGLPIVMTDVGCAGEVIVDGESGVVVSPGDVIALREALASLVADPSQRHALATAAAARVQTLPSFSQTIDHYVAAWQRAAARALDS